MNLNAEIKMRSVKDGWNEYDAIAVIDQDVRVENMCMERREPNSCYCIHV